MRTTAKGETAVILSHQEKQAIATALYERYLSLGETQIYEFTSTKKAELETIASLLKQFGYNKLLEMAENRLKEAQHEKTVNDLKEAGLYVEQ